MFPSATTIVVLGLATLATSHVVMTTPKPFGVGLDNSPLNDDGSDFPCKQRPSVYEANGVSNQMALGSDQPLAFMGSAVHGGGSCQISITYDKAPTKQSVWKVIHSIQGGCPMRNIDGNNGGENPNAPSASQYSFKVPTDLPTGEAVLAWTWFNRVGNREMYMNCAPVSLTGSESKRSIDDDLVTRNNTQLMERDIAAYNSLPDMFTANIGNGCSTIEGTNIEFPNPGSSIEKNGVISSGLSGNCASGGAGGNVATSAAAQPNAGPSTKLPGGVFITIASPTANPAPTEAPISSKVSASSVVVSSVVASTVEASSAIASNPAPSKVPSVSPPAATGTTGTGSAQPAGSACTIEGEWNCIGGTSFQQCGSGTWSIVQQLAAGTTCASGHSAAINISAIVKHKRAVRFSGEHIRRHLHSS